MTVLRVGAPSLLALALSLGLGSTAAFAADVLPPAAEERLAAAEQDCLEIGGTAFSFDPIESQAVPDLDGDRAPDFVLDAQDFTCEGALSLYSGTGGRRLDVLLSSGIALDPFIARGWSVVLMPGLEAPDPAWPHVLLLTVHGTLCGGDGTRRCVAAYVWQYGAFRSLPSD
ncbi:MAG: hypothetical protein AAF675_10675 [Pseudomonadota bacterium]